MPTSSRNGFCATLGYQIQLLLRKNFAIQQRNFVSTVAQFTLPLMMLLIVLGFQVDDRFNYNGFNRYTFERQDNPTEYVHKIPTCADFSGFNGRCKYPLAIVHDVTNAPTASADLVSSVINRMLKANPQIAAADLAYFNTTRDINDHLVANPLSIVAAVHFPVDFTLAAPSVTVQYNTTNYCILGGRHCTVQWRDVQLPVQVAVEEAILSTEAGEDFELRLGFARFPNPSVFGDYARDIGQFLAPTLILLATIFNFVVQLNQLVQEKELKLKLLLRISGVRDTAMWVSWWAFFVAIAAFLACEWYIVGLWFGNDALGQADAGVIIIAFFTFYLALSSWACFWSTYFSSNIHGYGFGFFLAVVMWLFQGVISRLLYTNSVPAAVRSLVSLLLPPFVWAKGYTAITDAADRGGYKWANLADDGRKCPRFCSLLCRCEYSLSAEVDPVVIMPLGQCIQWFLLHFVLYGVLAIYFDQTGGFFGFSLGGNDAYGRAQPWYYPFLPSYWCTTRAPITSDTSTTVTDDEAAMDSDVLNEMRRVRDGGADHDAIRVVNLHKTFKGRGCCGVPFTAVYRVNVGIAHETLFCLLGHNGAGKTTTFNMLSGLFEPSMGDAFVFGKSVKKQLRAVQSLMGICPQHDILWPELSGRQHLKLFAGLAEVPQAELTSRVQTFLKAVDLVEFAGAPSRKYSGGMKRRLSVACSLIADPKVVYLDEPTTGMDPVNRRGVWDVIEKAKAGRVVVLTTHAMEEADTLGDRISIMSRGRLHCIGTSLHLKNKYGTGYTVDISAPSREKRNEALEKVLPLLPTAAKVGRTEISATLPLAEVAKMAPLCEVVEGELAGEGVDMTVSMCTLETVFISIAESAGDPEALARQVAAGFTPTVGITPAVGMGGTNVAAAATATEMMPVAASAEPMGAAPSVQIGTEAGVRTIVIPRGPGEKLGLDLSDKRGQGVVVSKVHDGFAAQASGLIFKGDLITHVAGTPVAVSMKRDHVYGLIGSLPPGPVTLTLDCSARLGIKKPKKKSGGGASSSGTPSAPPSPPASPPWAGLPGFPPSPLPSPSTTEEPSAAQPSAAEPADPGTAGVGEATIEAEGPAERSVVIPRAAGQKLGLDMAESAGRVVIVKVHPGYAASAHGGVFVGDAVVGVGETSVVGMSKDAIYGLIHALGQGTPVPLTLKGTGTAAAGTALGAAAGAVAGMAGSAAPPMLGSSNHGSSTHGSSLYRDELDFKNVLDGTLAFMPTPFRTQFGAVALKNLTFQKRQPMLNFCCCFMLPMLFLAVYVLLMLLPGIIIGGATINCGSTTTAPSSVDSSVLNNNPDTVSDLINQLKRANRVGRCPSNTELINVARLNDYVFRDGCSNLASSPLSAGELAVFSKIRNDFGCNESFFQDIRPKYEYARKAKGDAELCVTSPNVTFATSGIEVTRELSCFEAFGIFRLTCTEVPVECPNNETDARNLDKETEVGKISRLQSLYGCSANAPDLLEDYSPTNIQTGFGTVQMAANVTKAHVRECLSTQYMCQRSECEGAPAFFSQDPNQPAYPLCDNTTLGRTTQLGAFITANGFSGAAFKAIECVNSAAAFCSKEVAFRECPRLVDALRPTEFIFSTALPDAQRADLGELRYSTASLDGCTDCFNDLLNLAPEHASGALGSFKLRQTMSAEDEKMALPTVRCAHGHAAGSCAASRAELDDALYDVWYKANVSSIEYSRGSDGREGRYQGAFHFEKFDLGSKRFDVTIMYNGSLRPGYDLTNEPVVPALAHRLASTLYLRSSKATELKVSTMGYPVAPNTFTLDFTLFLSWIFAAVLGFLQVVITFQMVAEKSTNMRELMNMAGLRNGPYWVISWGYGYFLYVGEIALFLIVAHAFHFRAVANHDFFFILVLLLIWAAQMTSFAMCMSATFGNKWAALVGNFFLLIIVQVLLGWQFADRAVGYRTSSTGSQFAVNLIPTFALAHAAELITNAGIGDIQQLSGIRLGFGNIGWGEAHPLAAVMLAMIVGSVLWMLLALYLDAVLTVAIDGTVQPGVKRHWLFLLHPSTYRRDPNRDATAEQSAKLGDEKEPPEVAAERRRVLEAAGGVRALGLGKWYKGAKRAAVVNVQFGISESECFGLLGSNGAGKSTTIHILCGLHPPTSGTVLCGTENLDVRTDITTIQSAMGVCSQDNLLWDDLTGPEHLLFFARLRRVAPKAIKDHIDYWLRRVNLQRSADRRKYSRSYSGGMKRRLGVANAFIGNPKLVYLDEPSTGLDPESRQQLWRAVLAAKPGKSIILTTHALEEAEALCDRVGIMTFGLMRTLGTPTELRIRFDQGYKFMLACEVGKSAAEDAAVEDAADRYVSQLMPQARQVDRINGVLTYLVPKGAVAMSAIFKGMEESKASLQIKDWGLSHTSLEEVFLQIVAVSSLDRKG